VDKFVGQLGRPVGVKTYKPFHSSGEDHLPSYLGMIGIPMDIVPEFPAAEKTILLTEQAKFDPAIVAKIKTQLTGGKTVIITSGLLKALQGKGLEDIIELEFFAAGSFALGVLSAFRSPRAYWMPARKCSSSGAFQKTGAPCPSEL
jgi:hypothetical protein